MVSDLVDPNFLNVGVLEPLAEFGLDVGVDFVEVFLDSDVNFDDLVSH